MGTVELSWEAPIISETLLPPTNLFVHLEDAFGSNPDFLSNRHDSINKNTKHHPISQVEKSGVSSMLTEVEPNNSIDQAQQLTGQQQIILNGNAEVSDVGELTFGDDDVEDLFAVTTVQEGLSVILDSFTSDSELYLMNPSGEPMGMSLATGASEPEYILDNYFAAGTYIIGVSIFDPDPIGANSTPYTLTIIGEFEDGGGTDPVLQSYNIYRSSTSNAKMNGELVGNVGADVRNFSDHPQYSGDFYYQVTAVYNQGESEPSNEASAMVTDIEHEAENSLLRSLHLSQNYPNPFNPSTTIEFSVPPSLLSRQTEIIIYNVLGKKVNTLLREQIEPGVYLIQWNGTDDNGLQVPSGVYHYRLQSGSQVFVKKMLLLK